MKTIIREHETGKARQLIEYAIKNNAVIATENPEAFKVKANSYGFPNVKIVSWRDVLCDDIYLPHEKFVIHNADKFLQYAFGKNCIGFSATLEGEQNVST